MRVRGYLFFLLASSLATFACVPDDPPHSPAQEISSSSPTSTEEISADEESADHSWIAAERSKNPRKRLRQVHALTLANSLEVLLISDPEISQSAAAMDIAVGSLQDPTDQLGIAHFLEHLLFLGSEKYPAVGDFDRHISAYQGHNNAYTAGEHTNFHFELNHEGFADGLDRFAQFFIAPKFDADFVERERNAVHAEHEKNLSNDARRCLRLLETLSHPLHPQVKFRTGNLHTLKAVDRAAVVKFYREHYSANLMRLVLVSKFPLEQLKHWVEEKFEPVPNRQLPRATYSSEVYAADDLPRLISVKPVKHMRQLQLNFATPSPRDFWQSKPHSFLVHLLGHEGRGSLLAQLRKEYLATGLSARVHETSYTGSLQITIDLTPEGWRDYPLVVERFFAYVEMVKHAGLQKSLFSELKKMARFSLAYGEKEEGSAYAIPLAKGMQFHRGAQVEENIALFQRFSPQDFTQVLAHVRPDRLNLLMIGPDVTTTQSEAYFGTPYKVEPLAATTLAKWHNPRPQENFFLPSANPYIPEHTSIPPGAEKKEPEHVIDEAGINFWLQVDEQYFGPRGKIELTLSSPQAGGTPQLCAKAQLYAALINEQVNEWAYQAMLAGTSLRFSASDRGLEITIAGYSSNISPLLARLGKTIKTITDDVATFSAVKDQVKQQLANNLMHPAYQRGGDELSYLLTTSTIASTSYYDPAQGIDEISPLSLDDMRQYSGEFFREVGMAGSAYGSFSAGEIEETLRTFVTTLHALSFVRSKWPIFSEVQLPSGQSLVRVSARPSSDDFALVSYQQFGRRSPASLAALRVGDAILRSHFYEDLRTTQQVGYIVGMQPRFLEKSVGLMFYLQSPHLQPEDLDQRVETWKGNALKLLATLTPQDFATYKQAIAKKLRQPCASLAEAQRSLHFYAFSQGRSSAHETAESLQALTALSKEELLALFEEAFLPTTGQRLSVYLYKENASPSSLDQSTLIKDPEKFRHAQATF